MRKLLSILLLTAVCLSLSACGRNVKDNPSSQTGNTLLLEQDTSSAEGYGITFEGVALVPGSQFNADELPQPQYSYTQSGNSFYNYADLEVVVSHSADAAIIQRVTVISLNLKTSEGLAIGDPLEQVKKLYGDHYTQCGDEWLFCKGNTTLAILTQDGLVAGMECRFTKENA